MCAGGYIAIVVKQKTRQCCELGFVYNRMIIGTAREQEFC